MKVIRFMHANDHVACLKAIDGCHSSRRRQAVGASLLVQLDAEAGSRAPSSDGDRITVRHNSHPLAAVRNATLTPQAFPPIDSSVAARAIQWGAPNGRECK